MAFVYDSDEIVGEKVNQTERTGTWSTSVEVTRIVLNAGTVSQLTNHLNIMIHTVFQTLGILLLAYLTEIFSLLEHVEQNLVGGSLDFVFGCHKNIGGEQSDVLQTLYSHAVDRVE